MISRCDVGAHQPVREWEYRVVRYLATANEPRWVADYHNALDTALDQLEALRANGDKTARLQECRWVDRDDLGVDLMAGVSDDDDRNVQWPTERFLRWCRGGVA